MDEEALKSLFLGTLSADGFARLVPIVGEGDATHYSISDMDKGFVVQPAHLVVVCDGYLSGALRTSHLQAIGFCLLSSERFEWQGTSHEGERVASVANDWASPEINLPITRENVLKWRAYLLGHLAFR